MVACGGATLGYCGEQVEVLEQQLLVVEVGGGRQGGREEFLGMLG